MEQWFHIKMGSKYIKFGDWDTVNGSELGDGYIYLEKKTTTTFLAQWPCLSKQSISMTLHVNIIKLNHIFLGKYFRYNRTRVNMSSVGHFRGKYGLPLSALSVSRHFMWQWRSQQVSTGCWIKKYSVENYPKNERKRSCGGNCIFHWTMIMGGRV